MVHWNQQHTEKNYQPYLRVHSTKGKIMKFNVNASNFFIVYECFVSM